MARIGKQWEHPPAVPATHFVSNEIYTNPTLFEEERAKIFGKVWNLVCHESEIPAVHDFRTLDIVDIPVLVARGSDGKIRGFLNACSHRGAKVVRQLSGNARSFVCPFHLWTYDTTGTCTAVTRDEAYKSVGCTAADFALREFRTELRHGLVFVCFDDDAESVDDYLGDSLDTVRAILTTQPLEVSQYYEIVINANWKSWHEINSELYHEYLHVINRRTSMAVPEYYTREWILYKNGHGAMKGGLPVAYTRQQGWESGREGRALPGLAPNEYRVVDLWPNTAFVVRDSGLRVDTVMPLAPDRALIRFRALAPKGEPAAERRARNKDHNQFWGLFGRNIPEDIMATELQRESMASGQVPFSLIAREEAGRTQDEITLRSYYAEWSRRMGRPANNPLNAGVR